MWVLGLLVDLGLFFKDLGLLFKDLGLLGKDLSVLISSDRILFLEIVSFLIVCRGEHIY